jgi:putative intracellular protease/amidase
MQPIGINEVNAVLDPRLLPGQRQRIIRFMANLIYRCFDVYPDASKITLSIFGPRLTPISTGPVEGDPSPVKSRVAQTIVPTHTFDDPPKNIDVLIIPGGFGAGPKALFGGSWEPAGIERVVQFLRDQYPTLRHLLSESILKRLLCKRL